MKKYIASAFIILIVPFLFPLFVYAYTDNNNVDWKYKYKIARGSSNFDLFSDTEVIGAGWQTNDNGYAPYTLNIQYNSLGKVFGNANNHYPYVDCYYPTVTGNVSQQGYINNPWSNDWLYWINTQPEGYSELKVFNTAQEAYEYLTTPQIDFDSIYYSAQIPIPSIDVYMGSEINNPISGQAVWNASLEFGDNSQYYIQYGYKASFPSYIDVGLASLRGDFSYNYYNYTSSDYIDIVSMESLTTAVNQSKSASYFQTAWQGFYDDYLKQSLMPEFGSQVNAMSTAMINDAKDYYVDYMMGQIPMYGNRLEIFARYFTIDEENNNRVIVGAWNHWSSKDGSRTKERPSNYIDNVALPGNIISNTDPDYQNNSDTYSSNGETTGTPATIINNNYAPNYPDYPTVATYNHDNILLNFMDTAKQLPSFFGEFTGFLTVAFGFIPSWIWTIIGMGFTFSIVIMIIKVL